MEITIADEFYYRIGQNEDEKIICLKYNTNKSNIIRNNSKLKYYDGEWVKIKVNDYISHFVKPMETLDKIASIYNMDKEKLKADNLLSVDKLYIGQLIKIYKKVP